MTRARWVAAIGVAVLGAATRVSADPAVLNPASRETPFDRGRVTLKAGGGSQTLNNHRYFGAGVGIGYYVLDGVELGLFGLHQFGNGPSLNVVTPSLRYVARPLVGRWPLVPYAGVFYNHWFVGDPYSDSDAAGTRAGVIYLSGQIIVGIGIVYEHVLSTCVQSCDQVYPDVTLGFTL